MKKNQNTPENNQGNPLPTKTTTPAKPTLPNQDPKVKNQKKSTQQESRNQKKQIPPELMNRLQLNLNHQK